MLQASPQLQIRHNLTSLGALKPKMTRNTEGRRGGPRLGTSTLKFTSEVRFSGAKWSATFKTQSGKVTTAL